MLNAAELDGVPRTVDHLDGRRANVKRVRDLVAMYTDALGGALQPLQRDAVQRAAELTASAEDLRKRSLRGESIPATDLVKSENLADRARRSLRIGSGPVIPVRTIRERLTAGA